jgi:hypothetical protein
MSSINDDSQYETFYQQVQNHNLIHHEFTEEHKSVFIFKNYISFTLTSQRYQLDSGRGWKIVSRCFPMDVDNLAIVERSAVSETPYINLSSPNN